MKSGSLVNYSLKHKMSHIGKKPVDIPKNTEVKITDQKLKVKGPRGELEKKIRSEIKVDKKENQLLFTVKKETKKSKAFWGTERAHAANMIEGVTNGFEKRLRLEGVGYRARVEDGDLVLQVGFSHEVKIPKEENVEFEVKGKIIIISGIEKQKVSHIAGKIRKIKPPNPYTGKGIRYEGEEIKLKPGKKAIGGEI